MRLTAGSRRALVTAAFAALCLDVPWSPARAEAPHHPPEESTAATSPPSIGESLLQRVRALTGTWEAQTPEGIMTDIFKPFAFDTAVLGEEWMNGQQITSSVFYIVNGELRVDHYCDLRNQPRYTAVPSPDPEILDLEFRDATNLDTHAAHFHSTRWRFVDATHLVQDWYILGGKQPVSVVHMEFTKR